MPSGLRREPSDRFSGPLYAVLGGLVFVGIVVAALACRPNAKQSDEPPKPAEAVEPTDLGSGIYYFPVTGESYLKSLVTFYEGNGRHCDLQGTTEKLVEVYPGTQSATRHTETTGFILHCHDLSVDAQDVTVP